jgi:CubicO group peptidase (beta-lactamase class C family)
MLTPERRPMTKDTAFDLASVTKVAFTTTEVLRLVDAGRMALDDPLSRHLPDLRQYDIGAPIRKLTIRQCLSHQTGLPAVEPIYTWGNHVETLKAHILQRDWPLGANVYSDINYMLLGLLLERHHRLPLIRMPQRPGFTFTPDKARTAATEFCHWRGRVVVGEVHDENAYALGGAAGHAGLFGTVAAVLDFARDLMRGRILRPSTVDEMRRPQSPTRGLGWERKHDGWSGGSRCSPDTVGHTGFTGTGLWLDFGRGYAWSLLTNRVHPSRHVETGIQDLRRAVGDEVAAALT